MNEYGIVMTTVENEIVSIHPYEVPEILMVDATDGYEAYQKWISENTI